MRNEALKCADNFLPIVLQERRQQLAKQVKQLSEEYRNRIRALRKDARQLISKSGEVQKSTDYKREADEMVQKETDKQLEEVQKLLDAKQKELTTI